MHYLIYKTTNKLNNKIYVGKHKTKDKNDDYLGSGILINRAIKKYGKENFIRELLFECISEEDMNQKEADIVDEEFVARPDTYNIKIGGGGGWSDVVSYKHASRSEIGGDNWKKGRDRLSDLLKDDEYKKAMAEKTSAGLRYYFSNHLHPWTGRPHSDETKKKMSDAKRGKYNGKNNPSFGTMWINDGVKNSKIKNTNVIPDGYKKGRLIQVLPK